MTDDLLGWTSLRLEEQYGVPTREPLPFDNKSDPLDELIYITLTQRTHSAGASRAYEALKFRFASWDDAFGVAESEITLLVEPSGLAFLKGPRVARMLRCLKKDRGGCDLRFLGELSNEDAYSYLTRTLRAG